MWGRGAAADYLPGHVCQQLLSWPREEQGGADLAGNQGKDRPFLTMSFSDNSVSDTLDAPKLTSHCGGETTLVSFPPLRQTALPSTICGNRTGCCRAGLGLELRAIYMRTQLFS